MNRPDPNSKRSFRRARNQRKAARTRKLRHFAKELLLAPTPSEILLRDALLAAGIAFEFQKPIGAFIPDFVFQQWYGIVEVDGGYHFTREQAGKDRARDFKLHSYGYQVMHFSNEQVGRDPSAVVSIIRSTLPFWKVTRTNRNRGEAKLQSAHMR